MKRTDRLTNIIALLLFLAFLAYAGVYLYRALQGATVTAEALSAEIELSGTASGIIIREELLLRSDEQFLDVTAAEGEKLAAGSTLGVAVSSEEGLERADRIHALEREISRLSGVLREIRTAENATGRDASLNSAARSLAAAVARHEPSGMDSASLSLEALLLSGSGEQVSDDTLRELEQELAGLQGSSGTDARAIVAEVPGVFSTVVDGYEPYGLEAVQGLRPSGLQELIDSPVEPEEGVFGKLVTDFRWYFAAVMSSVDAVNLVPGKSATLNFGRFYSGDIGARVVSVSASEDGAVVVIFRCDTALSQTLSVRTVSANVVFGTYSGIRIPSQAVRTDEQTQETYVWAVTAMQLERKNIEIIYAAGDYVIVRRGASPGALREGNTVVVSGTNLRAGKLIE